MVRSRRGSAQFHGLVSPRRTWEPNRNSGSLAQRSRRLRPSPAYSRVRRPYLPTAAVQTAGNGIQLMLIYFGYPASTFQLFEGFTRM